MDPLLSRPDDVRVLHVDDDPDFVALAETLLEQEAAELSVTGETDPTAAITRLEEERVDCVVSDYEMPRIDGLELLARVRERDEEVPFVLFTGKGSEEIAAEALEAGVDSYLRKSGGSSRFVVLAERIHSHVDQLWATRRAEKIRETYELLAKVSSDAFWIRNIETGETTYSEGISRFGYEPGVREDGFEWWVERVHPDEREESREINAAQVEGDSRGFDDSDDEFGVFSYRYRWRRADGTYVPCLSRGIVRFEDGEPTEMVGAMTDLAELDGNFDPDPRSDTRNRNRRPGDDR